MVTYCPAQQYDLVTCTGDALNHIPELQDLAQVFRNVYAYTSPGGYFVFDLLNENEASAGDPFEMQFTETTRVWFQMTRPSETRVTLQIRVYENGALQVDEIINETIHDPALICAQLCTCGFEVLKCADHLADDPGSHGCTWYIIAKKPE